MARNIAPQDVSWFLDLHARGRLDLNPPYQRKSVWTARERRFFLDTVFNGYPSPPVFLHKSISDEGIATYHVVDGKQRLETIIGFAANRFALAEDILDDRLKGAKWKTVDVELRKVFWNYQMAVEMLDVVDGATVREIFDRYNRTSKNLERQELRHARHEGWFATTAEAEVGKDEWRTLGVVTAASARRMRDVQFISELMMMQLKDEILGFSQEALDAIYADFDVPSEVDPTFSEAEFLDRFQRIKQYVLKLESVGNVVSTFAKSSTNFFSLWGLVAIREDSLPTAEELAPRYREFMERVVRLVRAEGAEEYAQLAEEHPLPFAYAQNARGAITELPQRLARHNALVSALLGDGVPANEDH